MQTIFITDNQVKELLTMDLTLEAVELAFKEFGLGNVDMPCKVYLDYTNPPGDIRVMPSHVKSLSWSGVKVVNVHPENPKNGLPTVMASIVLIDPKTGHPHAILSGSWITTIRTGAAAAVATKYLANEDAKVLGLVGAGAQAETQLDAIKRVRKLEKVLVSDVNSDVAKNFKEKMEKEHGLPIEIVSLEECVKGSDIISTVTPVRKPIIKKEWVKPGTHINAMGADAAGKQEIETALTLSAKVIIDDWAQTMHSGEINVPCATGEFTKEKVHAEIGHVVAGKTKGRESKEDITIFDSTGLGVQDLTTAYKVVELAKSKNMGQMVDFT